MIGKLSEFVDKKVHFIGIGGCGMSALAAYLHKHGAVVSGSDCRGTPFMEPLLHRNIPLYIGHDTEKMPACDLVIVTPAVKPDNCELQKAVAQNIPIIRRGEFLGRILSDQKTIAVAGAHGKTSTAALIAWMLHYAGFVPSALVGGIMENFEANFVLQNGSWTVTEADESDGSIKWFSPEISVILNVDDDHIENYGSTDSMLAHYRTLVSQTSGSVILNNTDQVLSCWQSDRIIHFGQRNSFHVDEKTVHYDSQGVTFVLEHAEMQKRDVFLPVPGRFFVSNFLAAVTACVTAGLTVEQCIDAAQSFKGVKRRGQDWGCVDGVRIIEDYAHHPTEISAILEVYRRCYSGKIACVFQPHRFTRSKQIAPLLADSFRNADSLIITDIYSADEHVMQGINGEYVFQHICQKRAGGCLYISHLNDVVEYLEQKKNEFQLIIFMGAGSIGICAKQFKALLQSMVSI
ncbi:UDP-N-acetylmuramate--L-alanine ligase [bacterium]|nr:UDP-N-acetylmuramate--L-alanine ligase [bacterium]